MLRRRSGVLTSARGRVVSTATVLAAAGVAPAATNTWDAPAPGNGNWFEPLNWSLDRLPTAADTAHINNGGTALIASGSAAAGQLHLGGTSSQTGFLHQSAGSLSVADLTVNSLSEYQLGGGSLQVSGRFNLLGELDFNGGTGAVSLANGGTLDWSRGLLQNARSASITAGPGTTIYLPVGVNPYT